MASMMFFQIVLLLGYLYSFWITRYAGPRARTAIHLALLAVSLLMLPVRPSATWTSASPLTAILWTWRRPSAPVFPALHHRPAGAILVRCVAQGASPLSTVRGFQYRLPARSAGVPPAH